MVHLLANGGDGGVARRFGEHRVDHLDNLTHERLLSAAGGDGRGTDTDTGGLERRTAVERHHVLVHRDVRGHERLFGHLTGEVGELRAQVDEHAVVVRSAGDDLVTLVDEGLGHDGGVLLHLRLVGLVFGLQRLLEGHGLGGNDVLQRSALDAGEDGRVEQLRHLLHLALRRLLAPRVVEVLT